MIRDGHREPGGDRRGQSEVIGYVAVFTIVILLVAVVTTAGYGQLREVRSFERANGAEQAVERFAGEVDALLDDEARQRSAGVELGGGSISAGEPVTVNVSGHAVGAPDRNFSRSFDLRTLVFEVAETRIWYVAGAVVRVDDGAVMTREPPGIFAENHTVLPLVDVLLRGGGVGGQSRVELQARRSVNGTGLLRSTSEPYEVNLSVESPWPGVWDRFFEAELDTTCTRSGDTVSCQFTTDRLSVVAYRIVVTHEG